MYPHFANLSKICPYELNIKTRYFQKLVNNFAATEDFSKVATKGLTVLSQVTVQLNEFNPDLVARVVTQNNIRLTRNSIDVRKKQYIIWAFIPMCIGVQDALAEADLPYIEKKLPNYPFPNVFKAIQISVDFL